MTKIAEQTVTILNKMGLHARPASQLAQLALQFKADITVHQGDKQADAASVLGLMMLESRQGKTVRVVASGDDAEAALQAVVDLISHKFNEDV
ncbi:MAG: HPr family phosphocarrier protein [Glaciecola sp.]|jgi:phosphocarrier protein NPr|nr:HPr family phosphocarrier protein [Glaciecola sp.]MDG1815596.1 HPr family phosphocarrier protein [Glaciecola sp.]MDG2100554.1 HPr family phosphocarrier protein [Glaciecola sp.]